jgi:hypothetical protein
MWKKEIVLWSTRGREGMFCSSPCSYKLELVNLVLQVPGVLATLFKA